jgi:DNA-binding transcriptional LysR family regulator
VEPTIEAVMAGLGVAVLPASIVRDEAAQQRLAAVPFEHGRHTVPVAVLHRKRRNLPPALQQFLQILQQPEPDSSPAGNCPSPTGVGEVGAAG